jgi:hypothetical protein
VNAVSANAQEPATLECFILTHKMSTQFANELKPRRDVVTGSTCSNECPRVAAE